MINFAFKMMKFVLNIVKQGTYHAPKDAAELDHYLECDDFE